MNLPQMRAPRNLGLFCLFVASHLVLLAGVYFYSNFLEGCSTIGLSKPQRRFFRQNVINKQICTRLSIHPYAPLSLHTNLFLLFLFSFFCVLLLVLNMALRYISEHRTHTGHAWPNKRTHSTLPSSSRNTINNNKKKPKQHNKLLFCMLS